MSTDRQKSFVATLSVNNRHLNFLDAFHDGPVYIGNPLFSGGVFSGRPQKLDYSHFLTLRSDTSAPASSTLLIYFRYSDYGYTLYIRTPGPHYGKCLSRDKNLIGAFPTEEASSFLLLNTHQLPINLEQINEDVTTVFLQVKDSGLIHVQGSHNSKYIFIADNGGAPLPFKLNILERNAPYISRPDEV